MILWMMLLLVCVSAADFNCTIPTVDGLTCGMQFEYIFSDTALEKYNTFWMTYECPVNHFVYRKTAQNQTSGRFLAVFACIPCFPNTYLPLGIIQLECNCNAGYASPTVFGCTACDAGKYRSIELVNCTVCPSGSYSRNNGASACVSCYPQNYLVPAP